MASRDNSARRKDEVADLDLGNWGRDELWSRTGFLVRRLHQLSVAIFLDEMAGLELTPVQNAALVIVAARPGIEQSVLAEELGIDRVNVGDVVLRLVNYGLMRRETSVQDRRYKQIYVTRAGQRTLTESVRRVKLIQKRFLAPLSLTEQRTFVTLLRKLIDGLNDQGRTQLRRPK